MLFIIDYINEFIVGNEAMIVPFKHLYQIVQPSDHIMTTIPFNDEWHFEFRVLFKLIELPGMKISYKIAIRFNNSSNHPVIHCFRQIVQRQPEQRKPKQRSNRSRNLHHTVFHKPSPRSLEIHVPTGNEGGIQRRVIPISHTFDFRFNDRKHPGLAISCNLNSTDLFNDSFGNLKICLFRLKVINTVACYLMAFIKNAEHNLRSVRSKVCSAKKCCSNIICI